ncbi:hypothetical protein MKQ70_02250 [Chitinophaga sedimenti]|uniref:hypothetical protein n=1 Tax=Chitinophaga sedimenti TaxID=2033606 RepID=UPI002004CBF0|nr:hypothetical protein [Chitinophaga sedimenti]MCK7553890.1 hypothetical protein [Chitinophaga sedimenti]
MFAEGGQKSVRVIEKTFAANASTSFKVANKYGKIIINLWDKNEIRASISVTGFGKSESDARDMSERVDIEEVSTGGNVVLSTRYKSANNKWIFGSERNGKQYVNVDYTVYIPRKLKNITLENSFGDILAHELTSPTVFKINYGFFDVNTAEDLYIEANYCDKGKIGKIQSGSFKINYTSFKLEAAKKLVMTTNNCDYQLGTVGSLGIRANYDDFKLERAESIEAHVNYTDLKIGHLESLGTFTTNYSDVSIKSSGSGLRSLQFNGNYSDLKVSISPDLPVNITAHLSYGDLSTGGLTMKNVSSVKKSSRLEYSGVSGAGTVPIELRGSYSDITFKTN